MPAEQIVYCADPSQPVMRVAPADAVFVMHAASTQQVQQYQFVPAGTAMVGGFSQGAMAASMMQWGH
jgi:predicted esterase